MTLQYVGDGAFVPGVPARDLTADEVEAGGGAEFLMATGLYGAFQRPVTAEKPIGAGRKRPAVKE